MKVVRTNTQRHIKAKFSVLDIKRQFDKPKTQEISKSCDTYRDFLFLKLQSPTIADIAYYEEIIKFPLKFSQNFKNNIASISQDSFIKYLLSMINKQNDRDFSKTEKLRKILINNDRFSLDCVKPKLDSKWQKIILKLKSMIWFLCYNNNINNYRERL